MSSTFTGGTVARAVAGGFGGVLSSGVYVQHVAAYACGRGAVACFFTVDCRFSSAFP